MLYFRVFLFNEGDKSSKESATSKNLVKTFLKGVREATAAFRMWQKVQEAVEKQEMEKSEKKPRAYKHIRVINCSCCSQNGIV